MACSFVCTRGYAGCTVLAFRGELDLADAAELSSQLAGVVSGESWVIVDLTELAFMDCSSLGVLAGARERARLAGGDVLLAGPRGAVTRLLLLTSWTPVFPGVGVAGFSAGLAAFSSRLAASGAGESAVAAAAGMATVGSAPAVTVQSGRSAGRPGYRGAA